MLPIVFPQKISFPPVTRLCPIQNAMLIAKSEENKLKDY